MQTGRGGVLHYFREERGEKEKDMHRAQTIARGILTVYVSVYMCVLCIHIFHGSGEGTVDQVVKLPHDFLARTIPSSRGERERVESIYVYTYYSRLNARIVYSTRDRIARVC